jgi:cytidyltransferase-like protein
MKLSDIKSNNKIVCVMGGRFQPFHIGHYKAYKWLCNKFGKENVWIATSNKTNFDEKKDKVSPLSFKERKEIIVGLYKIPERRVIQCKNPAFSPEEIFKQYKGEVIYVAACGDKDGSRYSGNFKRIDPHAESFSLTSKKSPYFVEIPSMGKGVSGTEVRAAINAASDDELEKVFKKYFGQYDSMVARLLKMRFAEIK